MNGPQTSKMSLAALKPHPLQSQFYGDCTPADDDAIATDLRQRGQLTPIVVMSEGNAAGLPDGTILDGHRRARLMLANGETEADVIVRHDLKDADALAVEMEFLKFNSLRRQLSPIHKARIAKRCMELENRSDDGDLRPLSPTRLREHIGQTLQMSGKNLGRYLSLLQTPTAVVNAVEAGHLRLVDGARVARLSSDNQDEIAKRIEAAGADDDLAALVAEYFAPPIQRRKRTNPLKEMLNAIELASPEFSGKSFSFMLCLAEESPRLSSAKAVIDRLNKLAKSAPKRIKRTLGSVP